MSSLARYWLGRTIGGSYVEEAVVSLFVPFLIQAVGEPPSLGDPLVDKYLRFTAARVRPNTLLAQQFDLKVFFSIVSKPPTEVCVDDVLAFIEAQRSPRRGRNVVRLIDGEVGLSAATIKRRLATVSSLFEYLCLRGLVARQVVPRSLGVRTALPGARGGGRRSGRRGSPLVRVPRRMPRVLAPGEVIALWKALRTERDRAMVALMLHGGLRRCEVLGLRFEDVQVGDRRVFVAEGKGGHQRLVPVSPVFFTALSGYLATERPHVVAAGRTRADGVDGTGVAGSSGQDLVFLVLKGPRQGRPLSPAGVDEVMAGARARAGLSHATCHELRHTCFTRLREAGMALEAIQAQAGHASIETTRLYLHLSNTWLAAEYAKAMAVLDSVHDAEAVDGIGDAGGSGGARGQRR